MKIRITYSYCFFDLDCSAELSKWEEIINNLKSINSTLYNFTTSLDGVRSFIDNLKIFIKGQLDTTTTYYTSLQSYCTTTISISPSSADINTTYTTIAPTVNTTIPSMAGINASTSSAPLGKYRRYLFHQY